MSKLLTTILLCTATVVSAQTSHHKLGITAGGGPQYYKGDLGNGIKGDKDNVWRGAFVFQAAYYLNRSFDAALIGSIGDLGYCQTNAAAAEAVDVEDQCPGCEDRTGPGNLNSRIAAAGVALRYKFANGYLLKEQSIFRPYVFAGLAMNRLTDRMGMNCVQEGNYLSYNAGAGVRYYVTPRIHAGYQLAAGYFNRDNMDNMDHGGNDMYIQSSLFVGIDLF